MLLDLLGINNRNVAIRIPCSDQENQRLEYRVAGADCNPYLSIAMILIGTLYGLTHQLEVPKQINQLTFKSKHHLLPIEQIEALKLCFNSDADIATLIKKIEDQVTLFNINTPKVIFNELDEAIYFSRQTIPHLRGIEPSEWLNVHDFYKHIGIYAYRSDILGKITSLPMAVLEKAESLEQLRWLAHGYKIKVAITPYDSFGIDVPADLKEAVERLKK